jgi:predicted dehydrogenase
MKLTIAIIGCGAITRQKHLPTVLTNQRFKLVALVDKDINAAKRLKNIFSLDINAYESVDVLPPIDAAIVAVPPHLHAKLTIFLLKKGVHVLCEKPMATTLEDAERMVKAAQKMQLVLFIVMQKYFQPNTKIVNDLLSKGILGKIERLKLESRIKAEWNSSSRKRYDPKYVLGGVLFESGIHWLYRIIYWFNYPKLLHYADDRLGGVEANSIVESEFKRYGNNIFAKMFFSSDHDGKNRCRIYCSNGKLDILEEDDISVYLTNWVEDPTKILEIRTCYEKQKINYWGHQLEYFRKLIIQKRSAETPTKYAYEALKFIDECYSKRVELKQPWVFYNLKNRDY